MNRIFLRRIKRKIYSLVEGSKRDEEDKKRLLKAIREKKDLNIVIGAGGIPTEKGWYATDIGFLNICKPEDWEKVFHKKNIIKKVMAEHVFEHLTLQEAKESLKNIHGYLANKGRIRIAVPDGFNPSKEYRENVRVKGKGPGADDHKILYTFRGLKKVLEEAGFKIKLVEWFDEKGVFHKNKWDKKDGKISRSLKFGTPNKTFESSHLSLIIDGIKNEK